MLKESTSKLLVISMNAYLHLIVRFSGFSPSNILFCTATVITIILYSVHLTGRFNVTIFKVTLFIGLHNRD